MVVLRSRCCGAERPTRQEAPEGVASVSELCEGQCGSVWVVVHVVKRRAEQCAVCSADGERAVGDQHGGGGGWGGGQGATCEPRGLWLPQRAEERGAAGSMLQGDSVQLAIGAQHDEVDGRGLMDDAGDAGDDGTGKLQLHVGNNGIVLELAERQAGW